MAAPTIRGNVTGGLSRLKVALFGFDAFISYAHRDGLGYAMALENRLTAIDYTIFRDMQEMPAGSVLRSNIQRALRRSRLMIVVDTAGARASESVRSEVADYRALHRNGRPLIGIQLAAHTETWPEIEERVYIHCGPSDLDPPRPSDEVLARIENCRRRLLTNRLARALGVCVVAILVGLTLMSIWAYSRELAARELAERNREIADANKAEAQTNQAIAQANQRTAEANARVAEERGRLEMARNASLSARSSRGTCPSLALALAAASGGVVEERPAYVQALTDALQAGWCPTRVVEHKIPYGSLRVLSARFAGLATRVISTSGIEARVWDRRTGKKFGKLVAPDGMLRSSSISPDGTRAVSIYEDSDVSPLLWETDSGEPVVPLEGQAGQIYEAEFSPDGDVLVTSTEDGTWMWSSLDGTLIDRFAGSSHARGEHGSESCAPPGFLQLYEPNECSAHFSDDGLRLLVTNSSARVTVWDPRTHESIRVIDAGAPVKESQISANGQRVMIRTEGRVSVWGVETRKVLAKFDTDSSLLKSALSPEGEFVVIGEKHGGVRVWSVAAESDVASLNGHTAGIRTLSCSRYCARVFSNSDDGTARVWDGTSGSQIAVLHHGASAASMVVANDGTEVLTMTEDGTATVWTAPSAQDAIGLATTDNVRLSPEGSRVAIFQDLRLTLIDTNTMAPVSRPVPFSDTPLYLEFNADGSLFLFAGGGGARGPAEVGVLRASDGEMVATPTLPFGQVNSVAINLQATTLAIPHDWKDWIVVQDLRSRHEWILEEDEHQLAQPSFDPTGTRLLTINTPEIDSIISTPAALAIWDVTAESPTILRKLSMSRDQIPDFTRLLDENRIIIGGMEAAPQIVDSRDGQVLATLSGHTTTVTEILVSQLGDRILTISSDRTARLWDRDGTYMATLSGHESRDIHAHFGLDGVHIVTTDGRAARIWNAQSGKLFLTVAVPDPVGVSLTSDASHLVALRKDKSGARVVLETILLDSKQMVLVACRALELLQQGNDPRDQLVRAAAAQACEG